MWILSCLLSVMFCSLQKSLRLKTHWRKSTRWIVLFGFFIIILTLQTLWSSEICRLTWWQWKMRWVLETCFLSMLRLWLPIWCLSVQNFHQILSRQLLYWFDFLVISEISFLFCSWNFDKDDKQLVQANFSCVASVALTKIIEHWFCFSLLGEKKCLTS